MAATATTRRSTHPCEAVVCGPRLSESPDDVRDLHAGVHHLVLACRRTGQALPLAPVVTLGDGVVELHLAAPLGRPPGPWRCEAHPAIWTLDAGAVDTRGGDAPLEPYPALVPVGRTPEGRWLLSDLGAAPGLVELDGPPEDVGDLQRRMAAELLELPWSRGVQVTVVGVQTVGDTRLHRADALADVVLPGPPVPGGVDGRWGSPPRDGHEVVMLTRPVRADEAHLVRSASRSRSAPTVIAPAAGNGVWQWRLDHGRLTW